MGKNPLDSKKINNVVKVKQVTTISEENHRQIFARLSDPIFNSGAMHGTPGQRKGKS